MAQLTLFLIDLFSGKGSTLDLDRLRGTGSILVDYFKLVIKDSNAKISFAIGGTAASVKDTDLVCYYLDTKSSSLILKEYPTTTLTGSGETIWSLASSSVISEVQVDKTEGDAARSRLLANLTFHEWMHNKIDTRPEDAANDVHAIKGGTLSSSGALNASMTPSEADLAAMRAVMAKKVRQFTGAM